MVNTLYDWGLSKMDKGKKELALIERRKLIRFGDGGIVVSVPKSWINKHKLKIGDEVYVLASSKITMFPPTKEFIDEVNLKNQEIEKLEIA